MFGLDIRTLYGVIGLIYHAFKRAKGKVVRTKMYTHTGYTAGRSKDEDKSTQSVALMSLRIETSLAAFTRRKRRFSAARYLSVALR